MENDTTMYENEEAYKTKYSLRKTWLVRSQLIKVLSMYGITLQYSVKKKKKYIFIIVLLLLQLFI